MAKVVHFEIPVDDPARAARFYGEVFDWTIQEAGDEQYWLVVAGPAHEQGVDGALIARGELHTSPVVVIAVDSIGEATAAVQAAGGEVLLDAHEIPGIGVSAYVRDPEGNTIGLFQALEPDDAA